MPYELGDTLATVTFQANSGLPQDAVVHSFAFRHQLPVPSDLQRLQLSTALSNFYRVTAPTAVNAIGVYLSGWLSRTAFPIVRQYRIVAGPLGSPLREDTLSVLPAPGGASNYPAEIACRLGLRADLQNVPEEAPDDADPDSGIERPAGRRRGGPYIGPLAAFVGSGATNDNPGVSAQFRADLMKAAQKLYDDVTAQLWEWSIWSRESQDLFRVLEARVDDAFDVQRKRGRNKTVELVELLV